MQYDCGAYPIASKYLTVYRDFAGRDSEKSTSSLWGLLATDILMGDWDQAAKDMAILRELIDSKSFTSSLKQLQQRTWLIHWSLFVFFNHQQGKSAIIELLFNDRYLNVIQTTCPHILRYLAAAVIINKKKRNMLKDLVKVIEQESYRYRGPITEFLESLYINFDFHTAEQKLKLCEKVIENDFFLSKYKEEFVENARLYIFESFCKVHSIIDIKMLSEKLSMKDSEGERWIVNLIRNARLDAKIDSANNQVILGNQSPSTYQQLIDKTKGLSLRSVMLSNSIERTRNIKQQQQQQQHQQQPHHHQSHHHPQQHQHQQQQHVVDKQ